MAPLLAVDGPPRRFFVVAHFSRRRFPPARRVVLYFCVWKNIFYLRRVSRVASETSFNPVRLVCVCVCVVSVNVSTSATPVCVMAHCVRRRWTIWGGRETSASDWFAPLTDSRMSCFHFVDEPARAPISPKIRLNQSTVFIKRGFSLIVYIYIYIPSLLLFLLLLPSIVVCKRPCYAAGRR